VAGIGYVMYEYGILMRKLFEKYTLRKLRDR